MVGRGTSLPVDGAWSVLIQVGHFVKLSGSRLTLEHDRARDTLNNPSARLNFLCVELQGVGVSYEMAGFVHHFPQALPQLRRESRRQFRPRRYPIRVHFLI